ncbi:hypothetical protein N7454_007570 [Penicillium verhagenii]|nr:hypothetical protein N7454_007570 [Penicillium verhagenii]
MGRTPSTSTTDLVEEDDPRPDSNDLDFFQQLGKLESARAFSIMRQIVIEIYTKQSVPLGLLQNISTKLQELGKKFPVELRSLNYDLSEDKSAYEHQRFVLRNANVACDYHFSMMLPTRLNYSKDLAMGAMQAIEAAISTVQLVYEIHLAGLLFNTMPLVLARARVFVSALTVCAAYLGQLGSSKEFELAIHRADQILQQFMKNSPQAKQYDAILKGLSKAAFGFGNQQRQRDSSSCITSMSDLFAFRTAF